MMLLRRAPVIVVLMVLAALTLASAEPANAQVRAPGCPTNTFCIHKQASTNPWWMRTPPQVAAGQCVTLSPQDFTRYVTNKTNYDWDVWLTGSCGGTRGTIYANSAGPMDANWSDRIRSVARRS